MNIEFPESLPINQRRQEIAQLISKHQVVIVAGETGSGKTTQLPKICLSLGLGDKGLIGHTQPRRIAARTVADRIASELKVSLGSEVGYQVRFNDKSGKDTKLKLMTDGVLLAEIQRDRQLKQYQTIIIDEAHERSLNIDFLMGLLKPICRKRPDLKVIITSATIDLQKFSNHFAINGEPAPIIEVSGRTYPVETVYQPPQDDTLALPELISDTIQKIARGEARGDYKASGDILVFCAGEREIREAAQSIKRDQLPVEVLPLYSRLSIQEQNRVFKPAHRRKVVLATNVAETSITVPGIAYVIDPGVARISRYSFRSKIQRLPIESISQASANQRQGRCGRVSNGVCIRLYSKDDFEQRPEFTQAEILRSNLASVILKMMRLGIKDIKSFDFIDRPDSRLLNDGTKLLMELKAIEPLEPTRSGNPKQPDTKLTTVGRQMSDLPIDPKFARILVAASELDCLADALVLISVLSIQDPRERPADRQQAADQKHKSLQHGQSDFFTYLHLWQKVIDERKALSNSQFKQLCVTQFWSIARIFEWRELYSQLRRICKDLGWKSDEWKDIVLPKESEKNKQRNQSGFDDRYAKLHQALLTGLASNIAYKDIEGEYLATRSRRINLFPSSSQAKRKPSWIVAGEYLETSRVFAINVAQINPNWVIQAAEHLLKYSYSSPHYHRRSGTIKAIRKTLFQGLILKDKETVNYAPVNSTESRQVFIQEALVSNEYQPRGSKQQTAAHFIEHNLMLIREIEKVEAKTRRRNLLISEQQLYDFFDQRLPSHINSRTSLETWLLKGNEAILKLNRDQLLVNEFDNEEVSQFPNNIEVQGKKVEIKYQFNPGQNNDGATMLIPISVLAPFPDHIGDWLVPGLLREKCIALIKTLPKSIRRNYAPASDAIDRIMPKLMEQAGRNKPLTTTLADLLYRTRGSKVSGSDFIPDKLDCYYKMNYRVIDIDGSLVDESRELAKLKSDYANAVQASVHSTNAEERNKLEKHQLKSWSFGELLPHVEYQHQGMTVRAFQMLKVQADSSVSLLIHDQENIAKYESKRGILMLARNILSETTQKQAHKYLHKELMRVKPSSARKTSAGLGQLATQLKHAKPVIKTTEDWVPEIIFAALDKACFENNVLNTKSPSQFNDALSKAKNWVPVATELETSLLSNLAARDQINSRMLLNPATSVSSDEVYEDIKAQLYKLFHPTFLRYTTFSQIKQYPRYLKAIESRLNKLNLASKSASEERLLAKQIERYESHCRQLTPKGYDIDFNLTLAPKLQHFSIMLEEWRVSIFAQHLRTQIPVSDKRLTKFWNENIQQ